MEATNYEDEGGMCLLGRLKLLKRPQFHAVYKNDINICWLRPRHIENINHTQEIEFFTSEFFTVDTHLRRIIRAMRIKSPESDLLSTLKACLTKIPELPVFQVQKPFLTQDGIDLGGVGRPDDLLYWIYNTNRDLMEDIQI